MRAAPKRLTGSGPVPTIGFITDWLDDSYHGQVLRGAIEAAHDRGANLVCFVGGLLGGARAEDEMNWVFRLARPKNVDGLIVLAGSIGNAIGLKGLTEFFASYAPMTMCSVAVSLEGVSSVCIDNEAGMRSAIEHLIRVHAIKRLAFVRGPEVSEEAELRLRVYRDVIEASGIAYEPELVVTGDFTRPAGQQAIRTLFIDRRVPVNSVGGIVAANDAMALGALDELRTQGIRVPDQIALVGFDNVQESRFVLPPLTTVNQPLQDQGRDAVRIVLEHMRTRGAPEHAVRRTELVVRRSCGCLKGSSSSRTQSTPPGEGLGFDAALIRRRQHILADVVRAGRGELGAAGAQWEVRLLTAAAEQIRGDSPDSFVRAYDDLLRRLLLAGADPAACNEVLSALRRRLIRCINDPKQRTEAEDFFHEARIMTTGAVEALHIERRLRTWDSARALMQAAAVIMSARDMAELGRAVHEQLPRLGIPRCFIVRLGAGGSARVVLTEKPDARKSDPTLTATYSELDILRHAVLPGMEEHALAVFPAHFGDGERALIILELVVLEDFPYDSLRQMFAAVLGRIRMGTSQPTA